MTALKKVLHNYKIWTTNFFIVLVVIILIAELFYSTSVIDLAVKTSVTALVIFSSFFLSASVRREIESKQKISRLLHNLDQKHAQLKVLDQKKSEFLSIASHHLRDPLTTIVGYASMLLEGSFGELSNDVKEAVDRIYESSKRLLDMISDFMDISNIESGSMKYNFIDVDIKKLVVDLVNDMKQYSDRANLHLSVTVDDPEGSGYTTIADVVKIRQVFSNIIDNSIKYTPKGDVIVHLSKTPKGEGILFCVSDTGIGMSSNTIEELFKKFSRAQGINKVYTEGTGLGLYVAKEIVEKHEGKIWAESKGEGLGSQFYVELDAKRGLS